MYQLHDHGAQLKYEAVLSAAAQSRQANEARRSLHRTSRRRGLRIGRPIIRRTATST